MTYETDIAGRFHNVGLYLKFDGIPSRLANRNMSVLADGNTYIVAVAKDGFSVSGSRLSERRTLIRPGGFSVRVNATESARMLLRHAGGTEDTLGVSLSAGSTTVTLGSGTNTYANSSTIYVDQETITLGTHTGSGVYTGCTRGAHDSLARAHGAGVIVSSAPRFWYGRRGILYAVNMDTGTSEAIRAGVLIDSPDFDTGEITLSFGEIQSQLNRNICTGWKAERAVSAAIITDAGDASSFVLEVGDARQFSTVADGFVRITYPQGFAVYRLDKDNVNTTNDTLTINLYDVITAGDEREALLSYLAGTEAFDLDVEVRQVEWIEDTAANVALALMASDLGDGANGTYDILPGVTPALSSSTSDLAARRMGAAIPEGWIDTASWQEVRDLGGVMRLYLDEQAKLLDVLTNEIAPRLGGCVTSTADGKLAFQRFEIAVPSSTVDTLDESEIVSRQVKMRHDEKAAIPSAIVECNYDHVERKHLRREEMVWQDVEGRWGTTLQKFEWASKTLQVGEPGADRLSSPPVSSIDIQGWMDRLYSRVRDGVRIFTFALAWTKHLTFRPGHRFRLTHTRMPDGLGSLGVTDLDLEVTGVEIRTNDGNLQVTAEEMPTGVLIAPACFVASYDGGTDTITIDTGGTEADLFDDEPGLDFPVQCSIRLYDASASPSYSASGTASVIARTTTTIQLDGTPGAITPAAGDIVTLEFGANTGNTNAAGADVQDHAFMAASSLLIDDGGANEIAAQELG